MRIRSAVPADASAVAAIYDHYVRTTAITFATHTPAAEHYAGQIADDRYPFLVAEEEGTVTGFAYAAAFREKEAYRWDVEMSIYLAPGKEGHGIGKSLMSECLRLLAAQGYLTAYSCITLPNERSVGLHKGVGFRELGVFRKTGYKMGKWHDVIWMGYELGEYRDEPEEPKRLSEL
ncbi:MAG: GNAT family N-acetyltransferase [Aristaeellaceae bacterium]